MEQINREQPLRLIRINYKTMASGIPYKLKTIYDTISEEPQEGLRPLVAPRGTVGSKELIRQMTEETTFGKGEVAGILSQLLDTMEMFLKEGYNVRLDGLGTFRLTAEGRRVKEEDEIRSYSIQVKRVGFTSCKAFRERFVNAKFVREKKLP